MYIQIPPNVVQTNDDFIILVLSLSLVITHNRYCNKYNSHLTALTTRGMVTTEATYAVIKASRIAR